MNPARKKTLLLAAVGLAAFAAVAAGIRHLAVGSRRHVDGIKGFSLSFPSGWEFQEGPTEGPAVQGLKVLGIPEGSHRAAVNVTVESLHPPLDVRTYRRRGIVIHGGHLPEYVPIGEGIERFANVEAPWIHYTYVAGPKRKQFQAWQFYLIRGSRGYVITCTADPAAFERFRPDFEEIVRSFRFE